MTIAKHLVLSGLLLLGLAACDTNEGPAERAGEKVDKAMQETQEQLNQAKEETGEAIEKAGDKVRDQTSQ
jgi:hypothetical protein